MIENPFSIIERRLNRLESLLLEIKGTFNLLPSTNIDADEILILDEAAAHLRISSSLIYKNPKKWGGRKIAGQWRFRKSELDKIFAQEEAIEDVLKQKNR